MEQRINYGETAPEALKLMLAFEKYAPTTGFDRRLRELIKIRASQINGCAHCLNMHTVDARKNGETEQRLHLISVWHDTTLFTEEEQVVLELTEAVTRISNGGVSDELYQRVRQHFSEKQYVDLVILINTINCWNRLSISMGNKVTGE